MIGKIVKEMKWVMEMNESSRTKGGHHHGKGISLMMSKNTGIVKYHFKYPLHTSNLLLSGVQPMTYWH